MLAGHNCVRVMKVGLVSFREIGTEPFWTLAGFAAWAPSQLEAEMLLGAWGILPPDSVGIFDKDPATLW